VSALVARNVNEVMLASVVASSGDCVWRESEVRHSVLNCYVWQEESFLSRREYFTFNLYYKELSSGLYFERDLQRSCCNKLHYCSAKKFILVSLCWSYQVTSIVTSTIRVVHFSLQYELGRRGRRPLHRDHFMIFCAFLIFSIPPVVPYEVQYLA
jgi:hypothetical protein